MVAIVSGNSVGLLNTSAGTLGERGIFGNMGGGAARQGAYVNVANGNLSLQVQDEVIASLGADVAIARTYNSLGNFNDGNGHNWKIGLHKQITDLTGTPNTAGSTLRRIAGDGAISQYQYDPARGAYVTTDGGGAYQSITYSGDPARRFTWYADRNDASGAYETYDGHNGGRILAMCDANGERLRFHYNTSNQLALVQDATGDNTYFDYADGKLSTIRTEAAGSGQMLSRVKYDYDGLNRLKTVTIDLTPTVAGDAKTYSTGYTYAGSSNLVETVSQSDGTHNTFGYVAINGQWKVAHVIDALGRRTDFDYSVAGTTTVIDPLGARTGYRYDAKGQLRSVTAPETGGTTQLTRFDYDELGNVSQTIDARGLVTTYGYDGNGNRILERDSAGNTIKRHYSLSNNLTKEIRYADVDPDGAGALEPTKAQATFYAYDSANQLRFVASAEGRIQEHRYNAQGQLVTTLSYIDHLIPGLDPNSALDYTYMVNWSQAGYIQSSRASRTDYTYSARGLVETSTTYGATAGASVAAVADGTQSVQTFVYDHAGQMIQSIDGAGKSTMHTYDGLGRMLTTTEASLVTQIHVYDDAGRRSVTTTADGVTSTSIYDAMGTLTATVRADRAGAEIGRTSYGYDRAGRLRTATDQSGARSHVLYDAAGRKTADITAGGSMTEYRYNANNAVEVTITYARPVTAEAMAALTDASGAPLAAHVGQGGLRPVASEGDRREWRLYDSANRLSKTVSATGAVVDYEYDGASRQTRTIERAQAIDLAVFAANPVAANAAPAPSARDRIARQSYDKDGLLRFTLDGEGYLSEVVYDAAGRATGSVRYATPVSPQTFASADWHLAPVVRSASDIVTSTAFNGRGLVTQQVDGAGNTVTYTYNGAGQVLTETRAGTVTGYVYDSAGRLAEQHIDQAGRDATSRITYDSVGNKVAVTDPNGNTSKYIYDANNRLVFTIDPLGAVSETRYNARGDAVETVRYAKALDASAYPLDGTVIASGIDGGMTGSMTAIDTSRTYTVRARVRQLSGEGYIYAGVYTHDAAGNVLSNPHAGSFSYAAAPGRLLKPEMGWQEYSGNISGAYVPAPGNADYNKFFSGSASATALLLYNYHGSNGSDGSARVEVDYVELIDTATGRILNRNSNMGAGTDSWNGGALRANPLTVAAVRGMLQADAGNDVRQFNRYDKDGRLSWNVDGSGSVTQFSYDAKGNLVSRIAYSQSLTPAAMAALAANPDALPQPGTGFSAINYVYDADNRLVYTIDAMGAVTETRYDARGNVSDTVRYARALDPRVYARDASSGVVSGLNGSLYGDQIAVDVNRTYTVRARLRQLSGEGRAYVGVYTKDGAGNVLSNPYAGSFSYSSAQGAMLTPQMGWIEYTGNITGAYVPAPGNADYNKFFSGTASAAPLLLYNYNGTNGADGSAQVEVDYLELIDTATGQVLNRNSGLTQGPDGWIGTSVRSDVLSVATVRSQLQGSGGADVQEIKRYDREGRLAWTVDAAGAVSQYVYDGFGNVVSAIAYHQALTPAQAAGLAADPAALPLAGAAYSATNYVYDANNRLVYTIDALGQVSETRYDAHGNVTETVRYATPLDTRSYPRDGSSAILSGINGDLRGNLVAVDTSKTYTVRARVRQLSGQGYIYAGVHTRDGAGNLLSNPHAGTFSYAAAPGYLLSPEMGWQEFSGTITGAYAPQPGNADYNKFFAGTATAGPLLLYNYYGSAGSDGTAQVELDYLELIDTATGQVLNSNGGLTSDLSNYSVSGGRSNKLTLASVRGMLQANSAHDVLDIKRYDASGRLSWKVDATGAVTQMTYDDAGNMTSRLAYTNTLTASDMATLAANPGAMPTPGAAFNATRYVYDANNRLVFTIDALGGVMETRYDALGQVVDTVRYSTPLELSKFPLDGSGGLASGLYGALHGNLVPVDTGKTYTVRARVRQLSGQGYIYAGVHTRDANGYALSNPYGGTYSYAGVPGYLLSPEMGWQEFSGNITGTFTPTPGNAGADYNKFIAGSTSAGALLLYNYYGSTGADRTAQIEVDYVELIDTATGKVLNRNSGMTEGRDGWTGSAVRTTVLSVAAVRSQLQASGATDVREFKRYNKDGQLAWNVDASSAVTQFHYDAAGNLSARIAYNRALDGAEMAQLASDPSAVPKPGAAFSVTSYVYDASNRLVYTIDPAGAVSETRYDGKGNVTETIRYAKALDPRQFAADGQSGIVSGINGALYGNSVAIDPSKTYTVRARLRQLTGEGYVYAGVHTHDANGYRLSNPYGGTFSYAGVAGHLMTPAMGWQEFSGNITGTFAPTPGNAGADYNKFIAGSATAGALLLYNYYGSNGADRTAEVEVDYVELVDTATGQVLSRNGSFADGNDMWTGNAVRESGLSVASVKALLQADAANDAREYKRYDNAGRLSWSVDATGAVTQYDYDSLGNMVSKIAYTRVLDRAEMAALAADPLALPKPGTAFSATNYVYDAINRLVFTIDAKGAVSETRYDAMGNVADTVRYATRIDASRYALDGSTGIVSGLNGALYGNMVAVDVNKTYTVRARLRQLTGEGYVYAGVHTRDANGYGLSNPYGGSYSYAGVPGYLMTPAMGWQEFSGNISGSFVPTEGNIGADYHKFIAGSTSAGALLLYNYYGSNGADRTAQVEVDYVELVDTATGQVLSRNNSFADGSEAWAGTAVRGNVLSVDAIRGLLRADAAQDVREFQRFDKQGRQTWKVDASGSATQYAYDAAGNVTSRIAYHRALTAAEMAVLAANPAALPMPGTEFSATNYVYDANNRLVYTIESNGAVTETRYDALGNVAETIRYAKPVDVRKQAVDGQSGIVSGINGAVYGNTVAIDTSKTYTVRARMRQLTGEGYVYAGVHTQDANGYRLSNQYGGTFSYAGVAGHLITPAMGWQEFSGTITGTFAPTPGNAGADYNKFIAGSATAGALLLYNYYGSNGADRTAQVEVDYVELVDTATGQVLSRNSNFADGNDAWTGNAVRESGLTVASVKALLQVDGAKDAREYKRYDKTGRLAWSVDATGAATQYDYDSHGNVVSKIAYTRVLSSVEMAALAADPLAVPKPGTAFSATNFVYDSSNRLVFTIDARGAVSETRYDALGNVAETVRYANAIDASRYALDGSTGIVSGINGAVYGNTVAVDVNKTYTVRARLRQLSGEGYVYAGVHTLDANGYRLSNQYGGTFSYAGVAGYLMTPAMGWQEFSGNITGSFAPTPGNAGADYNKFIAGSTSAGALLLYNYYGGNGADRTAEVEVDYVELVDTATGQVLSRNNSFADGNEAWTGSAVRGAALTVNAVRGLLKADSAADVRQFNRYDREGRLTWNVDGSGSVTQYSYDAAGNVTASIAYSRSLDAGELATLAADPAAVPMPGTDFRATNYVFDANNRLIYTIDPTGATVETIYDALGNVTGTVRYANQIKANVLALDGNTGIASGINGALYGNMVQVDVNKTYTVRARVRQLSGQGYIYAGVHARDAAGYGLSNPYGGSHSYAAAPGEYLSPEMGWREFSGNITGTFAPTPGNAGASYNKFIAGTSTAGALLLYNYYGSPGADRSAQVEIDYVELIDTATGQVLSRNNNFVDGDESWAGSGVRTSGLTVDAVKSMLVVDAVHDVREFKRYDKSGRVTWSVDGTGAVTQFDYDERGNMVSRIAYKRLLSTGEMNELAASAAALPRPGTGFSATSYVYDADNRLVFTIDPTGAVSETRYDAVGKVAGTVSYATRLDASKYALDGSTGIASGLYGALHGSMAPVDVNKTYTVRARLRQLSGEGYIYAGVHTQDAAGYRLSNQYGGTYSYAGAAGEYLTPAMGWREFSGNITGTFAPTPGNANASYNKFIEGSATAGALLLYNYYGSAGADRTAQVEVDYVELIDTATGQVLSRNNSFTGSADWSGSPLRSVSLTVDEVRKILTRDAVKDARAFERFDKKGQLSWAVDAAGAATQYLYDAHGNVVSKIAYTTPLSTAAMDTLYADPAALPVPGTGFSATSYVYDANNRLAYTVDPLGAVTENRYNALGQLVETVAYAKALDPQKFRPVDGQSGIVRGVNGELWGSFSAVDPSRSYTVRARVRQVSGAGYVYAGVYAKDANGNVLSNPYAGSHSYAAATGVLLTPAMGWREFQGNITGSFMPAPGNADYNKFFTGVASAAPLLLHSYYGSVGDDGTAGMEIDYIELIDTATGEVLNLNPQFTSGAGWGGSAIATGRMTFDTMRQMVSADAVNDRHTFSRYDKDGQLALSVNGAGAATAMRYDGYGNLVSRTEYATPMAVGAAAPVASAYDRTSYLVYDAAQRVRFAIDPMGYVKETRYDALGHVRKTLQFRDPAGVAMPASLAVMEREMLNRDARIISFEYDHKGQLRSTTDALGFTESHEYDALGNRIIFTNKAGKVWDYEYDLAGRMTLEKAPQASVMDNAGTGHLVRLQTRIRYDAFGNVESRTEAENVADKARTTWYEYDRAGRQTVTKLPAVYVYDGSSTQTMERTDVLVAAPSIRVTYDALGNAIKSIDAGGYVSRKAYDASGRVAFDIDAKGQVTGYTYDAFGQVKTLTRYAGVISTPDMYQDSDWTQAMVQARVDSLAHGDDRSITTRYDGAGHAIEVVESASYVYDVMNTMGHAMLSKVTATEYNAFGQVRRQRVFGGIAGVGDAAAAAVSHGSETRNYYNARGEQSAQFTLANTAASLQASGGSTGAMGADIGGYLTTSEYDAVGNLRSVREYASAFNAANFGDHAYSGVVNASTDRQTDYVFDKGNRKESETRLSVDVDTAAGVRGTANVTTRFGYDKVDNLTSTTDALGAVTYSYYDALGRVTAVASNGASATATGAFKLTSFQRDAHGNVVRQVEYANRTAAADLVSVATPELSGLDRETFTQYDASGRALQVRDANGHTSYSSYDVFGRLARQWQGVTGIRQDQYSATSQAQISYKVMRYDAVGNVAEVITPGNFAAVTTPDMIATIVRSGTQSGETFVGNNEVRIDYPDVGNKRVLIEVAYVTKTTTTTIYNGGEPGLPKYSTFHHPGVARTVSRIFDSAPGGATLNWAESGGEDGGIENISHVTVYVDNGSGWAVSMTRSGAQLTGGAQIADVHLPYIGSNRQSTSYNSFGEAVARSMNGVQYEYAQYDRAGQVWRTNIDDGVDKVMYYNVAGQMTAMVRSPSLNIGGDGPAVQYHSLQQLHEQIGGHADIVRTETRYDLMGREIAQLGAAQKVKLGTSVQALPNVGFAHTAMVSSGNDASINVSFSSLAAMALADLEVPEVRVTVRYGMYEYGEWHGTDPYDDRIGYYDWYYSHDESSSQILTAAEVAAGGATVRWGASYSNLNSVQLSIKDVTGNWVIVADTAAATAGPFAKVRADLPPMAEPLYINGAGGHIKALARLGDAWLFDLSPFGAGQHAIDIRNHDSNGQLRVVTTLRFHISVDGNGNKSLAWLVGDDTASTAMVNPTTYRRLDRWSNVVAISDARGASTWRHSHIEQFTYNDNNQVQDRSSRYAYGSSTYGSVALGGNYYDALGRQVAIRDANGNWTRQAYNTDGLLSDETRADGGILHSDYNVFGDRTRQTLYGASGALTDYRYEYDDLGHVTLVEQVTTDVWTAQSTRETYDYDELGRRTRTVNFAGTATMGYDLANNVISVKGTDGQLSLTMYDAFRHKIGYIDANGHRMGWNVDQFGRVLNHVDLGQAVTLYRYNGMNQLVHQLSGTHLQARGQDISFTYEADKVVRIEDRATKTTTNYEYDLAGNRIRERTVTGGVVAQNNFLVYDEYKRLVHVADGRFDLRFDYDLNGNRVRVQTRYSLLGQGFETYVDARNTFDAMNRSLVVNGEVGADGVIVAGRRGHALTHDEAGRRTTDMYVYSRPNGVLYTAHEKLQYDGLGRLKTVLRGDYAGTATNYIQVDYRDYDGAGRLLREGVNWDAPTLKLYGIEAQIRTYTYNAQGRTETITIRDASWNEVQFMDYRSANRPTGGYDNVGNVLSYTVRAGGQTVTYTNMYLRMAGYKQYWSSARNSNGSESTSVTIDANGNVASVYERIYKDGKTIPVIRNMLYDDSGHVLRKEIDGKFTYALVASGEMMGMSHDGNGMPDGFAEVYESATSGSFSTVPSNYAVQADGETPASIAQTIWGNSSLWYLIADANGLQGNSALTKGQMLTIPAQANTTNSTYSTYKPYNAKEMIGDTTPVAPPPPAAAQKGCGIIGQIIMIVVAVAVTALTQGLLGPYMSSMAAMALGAAAGSAASQLVGMAAGIQDKFSWKSVAMSALSAGVAAGVAEGASALGFTKLASSHVGAVAARAAISSAITQGIAVKTGLQEKFSWRAVAAAGAASFLNQKLTAGMENTAFADLTGKIGVSTVAGFASGVGAQIIRGGKIEFKQIAVDAFGNALGSSLAEAITRPERTIQARIQQLNDSAKKMDVVIDQVEARQLAVSEYELSKKPALFTEEKQLEQVDKAMRLFKATDSERAAMAKIVAEAQKPAARAATAPGAAPAAASPADAGPPPFDPDAPIRTVVVVGQRLPLEGFGKFLNDFQNPLATAGRMGIKVGNYLAENRWASFTLRAFEAITAPAMTAGRMLFEATDFGKAFNKKLETLSGEVMDAGASYVNKTGRINNVQKSAEMVGGLMLAVGLAVGGAKMFTKLAVSVGKFVGTAASNAVFKVAQKLNLARTETGCFTAGTLVWTRDGLQPIETIRVGQHVLSQPELTGERMYRRVNETFVFDDKAICQVEIISAGGVTQSLSATANHPFFVTGFGWKAAEFLEAGDAVELSDGSTASVATVTTIVARHKVYNFEVDGFHTYYVGEMGVWVHNTNCGKENRVYGPEKKATRTPGKVTRVKINTIDEYKKISGGKLDANTIYEYKGAEFETDHLGRSVRTSGYVDTKNHGQRMPTVDKAIGNHPDALPTDVGFHRGADSLGFPAGNLNVNPGNGKPMPEDFPDLPNLNGGAYKRVENQLRDLHNEGNTVHASFEAVFKRTNNTQRPDGFKVSYTVNGGPTTVRKFINQPGG